MPQNRRSYEKTRRIALSGLLFALAMALSFIEGTLTIPGLLPGMKLGLANIVVMYALFFMGPRQALVLDVLKALFVFLVSGFTAGFLSLCGGLLSLLVMWVLYYLLPVRPTWFILSVCGALTHNVGQLLGAGAGESDDHDRLPQGEESGQFLLSGRHRLHDRQRRRVPLREGLLLLGAGLSQGKRSGQHRHLAGALRSMRRRLRGRPHGKHGRS